MENQEQAEGAIVRFAKEIAMSPDALLKQAHQYAKTFEGTYEKGLCHFPKWFEGDLDQAAS